MSDLPRIIDEYVRVLMDAKPGKVPVETAGKTLEEIVGNGQQNLEEIISMLTRLSAMPEPASEADRLARSEAVAATFLLLGRASELLDECIKKEAQARASGEKTGNEDPPTRQVRG